MVSRPHLWDAAPRQTDEQFARCRSCLLIVSRAEYRNRATGHDDPCPGAPPVGKPKASNEEIMAITHDICGRARRDF